MRQDTHGLDARPRILVIEDKGAFAFCFTFNLEFEGWKCSPLSPGPRRMQLRRQSIPIGL